MQSGWNAWLHLGNKRSVSWSSNSPKHTAHSSVVAVTFTVLRFLASKVGKDSITARSRPQVLDRFAEMTGPARVSMQSLKKMQKKAMKKKAHTRNTMTSEAEWLKFPATGGVSVDAVPACALALW
ncbi:hypothetical protein RGQ29_022040 [Quercus rubra]|uniref:Uncharacterized protein n=1 Tax=Quercus rubra TaxID=3512 RepID=A0AAN7F251_QUERU|nr:hypothetical protein RGQ29_022040 [Quercus rubra]